MICYYCNQEIESKDLIKVGSFIPGVKISFEIHKFCVDKHKESRKLFDINEGNCNTCKYLERFPQEKTSTGVMQAYCKNSNITPYSKINYGYPFSTKYIYQGANKPGKYLITFHPDDPMDMVCYTPRSSEK